ncbi:MAG: fibrobacter succinogenes major paralogous domain-containing protein [Flavobacterium sp.]|nr:fibrobacter succinogenes major paralogous domain-containing protein [Flavobacterium sp.]
MIPQVTNPATLANISTGAWCYYQNSSVNGRTYGKLYNGWAVTDPRGLAPIGYHVPTDAEWFTLTQYLGGDDVAGGKMKTMTLWNAPNTGATNSSGFSALPGGYCSFNGYGGIGNLTRFWSSTDSSIGFMYHRGLFYFFNSVDRLGLSKNEANQVRCIKD